MVLPGDAGDIHHMDYPYLQCIADASNPCVLAELRSANTQGAP